MLSKEGTPELTKSWLLAAESFEPAGREGFLDEETFCDLFLKLAAIFPGCIWYEPLNRVCLASKSWNLTGDEIAKTD